MSPAYRGACCVSVLSVVLLVLCCGVLSSGARISNLTVYSDTACTTAWTNTTGSTWPVFNSLNDSQVDNTLLGIPGDCIAAISPTIQSARVACVTTYSTANVTLYTLSAVEWSYNTSCPTSYPFDVRYYFYGRANTCIYGSVTVGGVTRDMSARFSCTTANDQPNAAGPLSSPSWFGPAALLMAAAAVLATATV